MDRRKVLVLATAACALAGLAGASLVYEQIGSKRVSIETAGHPSVGHGVVEMVVIEDFMCHNCKIFSEHVLPEIESKYIETGRVKFTFVPVAFMEGSMPLGNAALGVYHENSDRFLPFVRELFRTPPGRREIMKAAKRVGGIDLVKLERCIDMKLYYDELEANLNWAKSLMGNRFGAPALFVNGVQTSTESFDAIEVRILEWEKRR